MGGLYNLIYALWYLKMQPKVWAMHVHQSKLILICACITLYFQQSKCLFWWKCTFVVWPVCFILTPLVFHTRLNNWISNPKSQKWQALQISGRTIKWELEHLVEVRPASPFKLNFSNVKFLNKFSKITWPKHTKTIELSLSGTEWLLVNTQE